MNDTEQREATPPAFQAGYWAKAPRKLMPPATVVTVRQSPNGDKEIVLDVGARLLRPASDIKQLILPGASVQVQIIRTGGGEIVTGLFMPEVKAWAWQMTAQDLADYAREVAEAVGEQRTRVRLAMVGHLKEGFLEVLAKHGFPKDDVDELADDLAVNAVIALEQGPA